MNPYLLLPLSACIACSVLTTAVLARDTRRNASRLGAMVALSGAWWACCDLLWSSANDPQVVLRLVRASALGWIMIGPFILHLFLELTGHPLRTRRGLLAVLYTQPAVLVVLDLTTPWLHADVVRTSWGWGYEVGPLFVLPLVLAGATVTAGLSIGMTNLYSRGSPAERRQTRWLFGGLMVPLLLGTATDGVLPMLGYHLPRLGAASMTLLVGSVAWTFHRFGYSLLAPGAFANEILMTLREGVALLRSDGCIHSANPGMGRLLAMSSASLEGRHVSELLSLEHPELLSDGDEVECSLTPEGLPPIPVSVCTSMLSDKQGNTIGMVLVTRDLREIESLRSRLITSGRLAAVGELAAGIAHEINNPVSFVRANLGALSDILSGTAAKISADDAAALAEIADGQALIEESLEGVDRVISIVRDVKGFAHSGEGASELIEIRPLLESVLRVAAPQLRYAGAVETEFGEVPLLRGAPQELKQVFLNLVINASQAVEGDEGIRLVTRSEGDRVIVEVHDQGCGIPEEQLDRVFDPFFTTKPVGEGTGLGLSISYQIVLRHGGELSVESDPERGTCFRVELPARGDDEGSPKRACATA